MLNWLAYICFAGSFLAFTLSIVALYRFPDAYTRMHGLGMGDTLGVGLMILGFILLSPSWIVRLKLLFVLFLYWIINPTISHLIAKAGLIHGNKPVGSNMVRKDR